MKALIVLYLSLKCCYGYITSNDRCYNVTCASLDELTCISTTANDLKMELNTVYCENGTYQF